MIEILDTTLRDGAQGEGVTFSFTDKLKLIRALDALGVDYIEAGNPGSNPKDAELFRYAAEHIRLSHARLAAFGMTCHPHASPENDASLCAIVASGAHVASIVGKADSFQVEQVIGTTAEENLRMIADSIAFLCGHGLSVFFDAEHFFQGYIRNPRYAVRALQTAVQAGASRLILCDTNGGMMPSEIADILRDVSRRVNAPIGIHCHNDAGLATACTLAAVQVGAMQVQGSINGYGERCGNANLCEVLPNLELKMGLSALPDGKLSLLTDTARLFSEIANLKMNEHMPYVGRSAFAHKGGMHIDGVLKSSESFEHVAPETVGNARRFLVSESAGRSALMTKLSRIAPDISRNSQEVVRILQSIKALEADGYSFEDADGSLTLRILQALHRRPEYFRVLDFHVFSRRPESPKNAQAYVKIDVRGQEEITADEGDGPVNALDRALRKALSRFYPILEHMRLIDFKVRVVNVNGTASSVRVYIESTDGNRAFSTVGVSSNIIEAAFIALTDSIECMLGDPDPTGSRTR